MANIFISYRRSDGEFVAKEITVFLEKYFGTGSVFRDEEKIPVASDFRTALSENLKQADVLIAVITEDWIGADLEKGNTRIADPNDYIRYEIGHALHRQIPIVPFVLSPAQMPRESELPEEIRALHSRQAMTAYRGQGFGISLLQLVEVLFTVLPQEDRRKSRHTIWQDTQSIVRGEAPTTASLNRLLVILICAVLFLGIGGTIAKSLLNSKHSNTGLDPGKNRGPESLDDGDTKGSIVRKIWTRADRLRLEKEIASMKARLPAPRNTRIANSQEVKSLGFPDYSSFEILSDDRYWDLRGWADLSQGEGNNCNIILKRRIRLLKVADANEIRFEVKTDGSDLFIEPISDAVRARELVSIDPAFVGERKTKLRQLVIDVSEWEVGHERTIEYMATYWNSLQDPDDRWLGAIGYPRADRLRIYILLPENQPYKNFELREAPSFREESKKYDGPLRILESEDRSSLLWEVPTPRGNWVYTIILDW